MEPEAKSKGGRPRKFDRNVRNPTLAFRVRGDLYEQIKTAAGKQGVSLSEEIERRLIRTFSLSTLFDIGVENENLAFSINSAISFAQQRTGKPWFSDELTRRIVAKSLVKIAEMIGLEEVALSAEGEAIVAAEASIAVDEAMDTALALHDPRIAELAAASTSPDVGEKPKPRGRKAKM